MITEELGLNIEKVGAEVLGTCKKVTLKHFITLNNDHKALELFCSACCFLTSIVFPQVTVSKDETVVLDGAGDKKALEERCEQVQATSIYICTYSTISKDDFSCGGIYDFLTDTVHALL